MIELEEARSNMHLWVGITLALFSFLGLYKIGYYIVYMVVWPRYHGVTETVVYAFGWIVATIITGPLAVYLIKCVYDHNTSKAKAPST